VQQLENALLGKLLEGAFPKNASKDAQENLREQFRGHIRETEGYNRMIRSGDGNISNVLNDPPKMACVYADVLNGIMEKMDQNVKDPKNDEPQRNNEMEMNQGENIPQSL
jgi:ferritin-like metal-binding protein YciE